MDDFWAGAQIISVYTREQALADGELFDVTEMAKEAGIKVPVAVTRRLWAEYITPNPRVAEYSGQTVSGRLWDTLFLLYWNISKSHGNDSAFIYSVIMVMNENDSELVKIKAVIHGGDHGEPVMTLMMPDED